MNASELAELRCDLLARLSDIVRSAPPTDESQVAEENAVERDPEDEGEHAVIDELDAIIGELGDREAHLAEDIVAALQRLRTGEYGLCIDCGQEVAYERLKAVPWTLRCAVDQDRFDGNVHPPSL